MTTVDPELLRALAAADAARPIAPGADFTPESLTRAAARRLHRRFAAGGVLLAAFVAAFAAWPRDAHDDDVRRGGAAVIAADLGRLQRWIAECRATDADRAAAAERERRRDAAANAVRCDLALARSSPLPTVLPPRGPR